MLPRWSQVHVWLSFCCCKNYESCYSVHVPPEIKAACIEIVSQHLCTKRRLPEKWIPTPHMTVPILFVALAGFLCFPKAPDVRNKGTTPKFGVPLLFQSGGRWPQARNFRLRVLTPQGQHNGDHFKGQRKSGRRAPPLLAIFPLALKWPPLYCPLVRPRLQRNIYDRVFL